MDGLIALALAKKAASSELSQKLGAISTNLEFKGNVSTIEELPSDAEPGDEYAVNDSGLYVWNGSEWVSISIPGPIGPQGPKGDPGSGAVTVFYQTEEPEVAADGDIWVYKAPPVNYLCFTAEEANAPLEIAGLPGAPEMDLWYSYDKNNWTQFEIGVLDSSTYEVDTHGTVITLANVGDKVYFKGNNDHGFCVFDEEAYYSYPNEFIIREKNISVSGNIMTLMDETGEDNTLYENNFNKLFIDCYKLTDASELELPATVLAPYCYSNMFTNWTEHTSELVGAPELPATTLAEFCYNGMFYGCTSLMTPPELPATILTVYCYYQMFFNCTSIKLSSTQTIPYNIPYRIPSEGTGTSETEALGSMFANTGGTFQGTPTINTTYYLAAPATN